MASIKRSQLTPEQLDDAKRLYDAWQTFKRDHGSTQAQLADALGYETQSAVSQFLTGRIPLNMDALLRFATYFNVKPQAISPTLSKLIIKANATHNDNVESAPILGKFKGVPVVGFAQLGDNGYWSEIEYPVGHGDGYINYPTRDQNAYAVRCVGDSMKPRIRDGEFVIVEPNSAAIPGDEVLLKTTNGRVMVKTYLYYRDDRVHVMSVNDAHPAQSFPLSEIEAMHPVAAIVKKALWIKG